MEPFVNREKEMHLVEEKFNILLDEKSLIRTPIPIIQFNGISGIGKTTMLQRLKQLCNDRQLPYIWADASQGALTFAHEIINQIIKDNQQITPEDLQTPDRFVAAARGLLQKSPLVMLLDSLDMANTEQLRWIEALLRDLVRDNRLFVILASKKPLLFESERSVTRKLKTFQLKPLDRDSCESYLNALVNESEVRDVIFQWTLGYPLAINVMVQAISENRLDPRKKPDDKKLLSIMTEHIVNHGVLANVQQSSQEFEWYQMILALLSVPRRFNLKMIQRIIESFAPQYALQGSLAYLSLPRKINQKTDILLWDTARAGFSIELPIRHIFLMKLKIEQPQVYYELHSFLAQTNRQLADFVSGSDRLRYLQEYLYHSAHASDTQSLPQTLERTVLQISQESQESLAQFHEEYAQDEELRKVLGDQANTVFALIYKHFASLNRDSALSVSGSIQVLYLREFCYYSLCSLSYDPTVTDLPKAFKEHMLLTIKDIPADISTQLHEHLVQDEKIQEILGEQIQVLSFLLQADTSSEG